MTGGALPAAATQLPCTEQGIRDAVALGGGPHTFDCVGPTTVVLAAQIEIAGDVILDGEGNLTLDGNEATRVFMVSSVDATVELHDLTITRGASSAVFNVGTLLLSGCTVSGSTGIQGGGVWNGFRATLTLENSLVSGNTATGSTESGGGIYNTNDAMLVDSIVSGNIGLTGAGGGIYSRNDRATLTLVRSIVSDNEVQDASPQCGFSQCGGGGIFLHSGTLSLTDSTVSGNYAFDRGGGIAILGGTATLVGTTVSGNLSDDAGEGIYNTTTLALTNSTVSGNGLVAPFASEGGGILNTGTLTLTSSTLSENLAVSGGSVFNTGTATFANTVIDESEFGNGACLSSPGVFHSDGGNIETLANSTGDSCGLTDPSDQVDVAREDLALGPLADNGGPTLTHALGPGSVAHDNVPIADCVDDMGMPLLADQRGVERPQGPACDTGAVEVPEPESLLAGFVAISTVAALGRLRRRGSCVPAPGSLRNEKLYL